MTSKIRSLALPLFLFACATFGLQAQTALTQTTLSAAITSSQNTFKLASVTGITANQTELYIDLEAMPVYAVSGNYVTVGPRGSYGTKAMAHVSGAGVLYGPPAAFIDYDPTGACTAGTGLFLYAPIVDVLTGGQWLCSSVLSKVVPGFGNFTIPNQVSTAVASAAGLITPSGPLFHITGTAAITGFNIPVGFDPKAGGGFCVVPDGIFTTTNATNIGLASTAVVSKLLCWTYDANSTKFYPSY